MFELNEKVLVKNNGVCIITEIADKDYGSGIKKYYVLKPIFKNKNNVVMIPCDNCPQIRPIITKKIAMKIIKDIPNNKDIWINNSKDRKEMFNKIISDGNEREMSELLTTIYSKKKELAEQKKFLNMGDKYAFENCENIFYEELATALSIEVSEVGPFIDATINK